MGAHLVRSHLKENTHRSRVDGADSRVSSRHSDSYSRSNWTGVLTPRVVLKNSAFLLGGPADSPYSYLTLMIRFANSNHVSSSLAVKGTVFLFFGIPPVLGLVTSLASGRAGSLLPVLGLVPRVVSQRTRPEAGM